MIKLTPNILRGLVEILSKLMSKDNEGTYEMKLNLTAEGHNYTIHRVLPLGIGYTQLLDLAH